MSEIVDVKVYTAAQSDERFQTRGDYATKADVAASTSPLSGRVDALEGESRCRSLQGAAGRLRHYRLGGADVCHQGRDDDG